MSNYIGARYVIKIYENTNDPSSAEWQANTRYEPITMVTFQNSSYLSKMEVPQTIGNPAENSAYWVCTGNYNGQIANLQQQIDGLNKIVETPAALRTSGYPFAVGDVISVASNGANFIVESTSTPISIPLQNGKYARLLPDENGAYHVSALGLANYANLYPILNYMLNNNIYDIYINNGRYTLSETLSLPEPTPQIKIVGESMEGVIINCTKGFLDVNLDGAGFVGSEISHMTIIGTATALVGGDYNGINVHTKNETAEDMADYLLFHELDMRYFAVAIRFQCRVIWCHFEQLILRYNKWAFYYAAPANGSFFNNNTFVSCEFASSKWRGFVINGVSRQAISNTALGCDFEANHYLADYYQHNAEIELHNAAFDFIGCHFERVSELNVYEAIYVENSNVRFDVCSFVYYNQNVIANEGSTAIFNQSSNVSSSMTARIDTGTTRFNDTYTFA